MCKIAKKEVSKVVSLVKMAETLSCVSSPLKKQIIMLTCSSANSIFFSPLIH